MLKFTVISETDIFGKVRKKRKRKKYEGRKIRDFTELDVYKRQVYRRIISGEFPDGLHIAPDHKACTVFSRACLADLSGSTCRGACNLRSGRCQDTLYVYKIWTFLFDYSWNYADSGIEDLQRTGACKGNDYSVYRWIPDRRDIFLSRTVCTGWKLSLIHI